MFASGPDRGPPSTLRGWLSDVYLPALLDVSMRDRAIESLAGRLGAKAVIDDPLHGRAVGLPAINEHLKKTAEWLSAHAASYERTAFTTGIDRDVTEGMLSLEFESKTVDLPVAVVAERRRSREVELRVYHAVQTILPGKRARAQLLPPASDLVLPTPIGDFLDALGKGDTKAVATSFESDGSIRDARGLQHGRNGGELETFVDTLVAGGAFGGGLELTRGGVADDGRTCGLEYTLVKARGSDVAPQAGLMMFERGDTGLLRTLRVYGDLES